MILIINRQRKIKVNINLIKKDIEKLLNFLNYKDFDISLLLTTNKSIKNFNKVYRKKDKPTDILSFPYHTTLKPGQKIKILVPEDKNLGDIIISLEFALKDAKKLDYSLQEHLRVLIVHGVAHLLGHDHNTDQEYYKMKRFEQKLLKFLQL